MTKRSKNLIQCAVLGSIVLSGATQARATYVISDGGSLPFNLTWDGHNENANAGALVLTSSSIFQPSVISVCTDIGALIIGGAPYSYSGALPFNGQTGISPTWGAGNQSPNSINQPNAAAAIQVAADVFYKHSSVLAGTDNVLKAALQLAVWEALYDTSASGSIYNLGVGQGRFYVNTGNSTAIADALSWLGESHTTTYAGYLLIPQTTYFGLPAQEVFAQVVPVPEPTTLIAGALLLVPFGASTLRFMRKSRTA
jgi:hypothetical protein